MSFVALSLSSSCDCTHYVTLISVTHLNGVYSTLSGVVLRQIELCGLWSAHSWNCFPFCENVLSTMCSLFCTGLKILQGHLLLSDHSFGLLTRFEIEIIAVT